MPPSEEQGPNVVRGDDVAHVEKRVPVRHHELIRWSSRLPIKPRPLEALISRLSGLVESEPGWHLERGSSENNTYLKNYEKLVLKNAWVRCRMERQ